MAEDSLNCSEEDSDLELPFKKLNVSNGSDFKNTIKNENEIEQQCHLHVLNDKDKEESASSINHNKEKHFTTNNTSNSLSKRLIYSSYLSYLFIMRLSV